MNAALAVTAAMVALWAVSVARRDSSLVDLFWGPGFALVAVVTASSNRALGAGQLLLVALVSLWGLRLGLYLARRNLGHGEDHRYQAMRQRHGDAWWWRSLFIVFGLQGALMLVVSLPLQRALEPGPAQPLSPGLLPGVALFGVGLFFEAVGDWQLARFRRDPANAGQVMDRGLWRYTRHPNYFGDFCLWWGLYAVSLALGAEPWTAVGPLVMSVLLRRVSGVSLLEKSLKKNRPGYVEYIERTNAFFPWWPRAKKQQPRA